METEQVPEAGDRDARSGRFLPGNTAGRGNPHALRRAEMRAAVAAASTPETLARVLSTLQAQAEAGDVQAARTWLEYALGKPRTMPEHVELDLGALDRPADVLKAFSAVVAQVAAGEIDVASAASVGALLEGARRSLETLELEARMTALENRRA
jgi:hypothetical protein